MRQEFNLKSMSLIRPFTEATIMALPAIGLIVQQYGWTGLAIAAGMVASGTYFVKNFSDKKDIPVVPAPDDIKLSLEKERGDPGRISQSIRTQKLCDDLTSALGMQRIEVKVTDKTKAAATNGHHISIHPDICGLLNDNELKCIIAHELDHFRNMNPDYCVPPRLAQCFNLNATALSMVDVLCGNGLGITSASGFLDVMSNSFLIHMLLTLSSNRVSRQDEYRSDSNALRMTEDLPASISALEKISHYLSKDDCLWDKVGEKCFRWLASHPSNKARAKNMACTYRDMVQEKLSPPSL